MSRRSALTIVTLCGFASGAGAQELIRVSYSASTVFTGTTTPSGGTINDLEPNESVRFQIGVEALMNGTSAIGQTTTYTPPPPPGTGTIRGLGSFLYDFVGSIDGAGTWYGQSVSAPFTTGATTGTPSLNGSSLVNIGGGQFLPPGATANGVNPVPSAFVGYWSPNSYSDRWVYFQMQPSQFAPTGQQNAVVIQFDNYPESGDPAYAYKYVPTDFGPGISIGIGIPAPSGAGALGLGMLVLGRRRRQPVP